MKKYLLLLLAACFLVGAAFTASAQGKKPAASPADSAMVSNAGADVKIYYSRPSKKGRAIFGAKDAKALVPYGEIWRTGANSATEIVFSKDVTFGGKPLKAGRYSLYTIPTKDKWTVILNSKLGQWGTVLPNPKEDALRVEAMPTMATATEQFTIKLDKADKGAMLVIMWDTVSVSVPITVN